MKLAISACKGEQNHRVQNRPQKLVVNGANEDNRCNVNGCIDMKYVGECLFLSVSLAITELNVPGLIRGYKVYMAQGEEASSLSIFSSTEPQLLSRGV